MGEVKIMPGFIFVVLFYFSLIVAQFLIVCSGIFDFIYILVFYVIFDFFFL